VAVEGVKVSPGLALGTRIAFKGKGEKHQGSLASLR